MNSKKMYLFLLFLFFASLANAQSFTASAKSPVGLNDRFQVTFSVEGSDINSITAFQPPAMNDFLILSGPNQSQSMQIINGAVSGSRSFSYILQPKSLGKFTIPPATIMYAGKQLRSNSLTIEVTKGTPQPKTQKEESGISKQEIAENLFIRAITDKTTMYKGEQVTVTYKLYRRVNITSLQISKLPSYQGFWAEEIPTSMNINFTRENYNGKVFESAVIKKAALFPTESGDLSLTPFELLIPVVYQKKSRSNNPFDAFFDDPFFGRTETVEFTARSNTVRIKVLPLPETTIESFNGAVGSYSMNAVLEKRKVRQHEPLSLKVDITGSGNLKLITNPTIKLPSGFEEYEPKITEEINRGGLISGRKRIEYLFIPRNQGKFEIPPVEFTYFDLKKKNYVTLKSVPFSIEVEKGTGDYVSSSGVSKDEVKLLGNDIRFIKTDPGGFSRKGDYLFKSTLFIILSVIPILGLGGLLFIRQREEKLLRNIPLMKNLKAQKIAKARLKNAFLYFKESKPEQFYSEISLTLFGYMEDKLGIQKSELTIDTAVEKLTSNEVEESLRNRIKNTLETCEFIRFSPGFEKTSAMQEMYNTTRDIIVALEEDLASKGGGKRQA